MPASGTITLTFAVTVSTTPGTYTNQAGGVGQSPYVVVGTGQTAPVTVVAAAHLTLTKQRQRRDRPGRPPGPWPPAGRRRSAGTAVTRPSPTPRSTPGRTPSPRAVARPATAPAPGAAPAARLTGSSLVLAAGETASCSITNTFIPPAAAHLTLTKQRQRRDRPAERLDPGRQRADADQRAQPVTRPSPTPRSTPGTYTLAESGGPTGYSAGAWGCTGGTPDRQQPRPRRRRDGQLLDHQHVHPAGRGPPDPDQAVVSGGTALATAWTLAASGPTPISGHSGDPAITDAAVDAGHVHPGRERWPDRLQRRRLGLHRRHA